jgi:hypothetical protein
MALSPDNRRESANLYVQKLIIELNQITQRVETGTAPKRLTEEAAACLSARRCTGLAWFDLEQ